MIARLLALMAVTFTAITAMPQALTDIEFDGRLKRLESELRCLVCQNQTLADSNAPLAEDLRREVRALATSGKSDEEIREYLVARYGDFVLYKPPLQRNTWLLWIGPFGLLLGGGIVWYAILRRRKGAAVDDDDKGTASSTLPEEAVARARQAIYEEP
jgi:cytochrome c-type biogenesis protein CcmH